MIANTQLIKPEPMNNLVPATPSSVPANRWGKVLTQFLAILCLLLLLYHDILKDMVLQWWEDPNYSHGFLVPFFSLYVIWQRRDSFKTVALRGSWYGLPVLLLGLLTLLLGKLGAENFLMRCSFIIGCAGLILFHLGAPIFRLLAFPVAFLFLMIPWPAILFYKVSLPLQRLSVHASSGIFELFGVPCLVEGNVIHFTAFSLGVNEACSGIRSLISYFALATAWSYLSFTQWWPRCFMVLLAIPLAVSANITRLVVTGFIAFWLGIHYAMDFFHTVSGWLIFIAIVLGLVALNRFIEVYLKRTHR
jgi:exosortase